MRKTAAAAAAFSIASAIGAGIAGATPPERVTICHGTASETNPYVIITVADSSFKDGHFDGVPNPSHGKNNNPDMLYHPDTGTCGLNS